MKRIYTTFYLAFLFSLNSFSQQWVSTVPENRHALIEEFTGVQCAGCPAGAEELEHLLQVYNDQLCVVGYHQPNTLFCVPYGNDPDFRRPFLAAYATPAFNFTGGYPTAFVQRKMWSGETYRNFMSYYWETRVQDIIAQPSPVNIGLNPVYNPATNQLTVDVEVYFTGTVSDPLTMYVQFSESGMIAMQKVDMDYDTNHVHSHVFREALCAQWGDPVLNTSQGTLFTDTYVYDNSANQYIMPNCEVLVFVRNAATEEIITANRKMVSIPTSVNENEKPDFNIYPNPFDQAITLTSKNISKNNFRIFDLLGQDITDKIIVRYNDSYTAEFDFSAVPGKSLYLIKTNNKVYKVDKK